MFVFVFLYPRENVLRAIPYQNYIYTIKVFNFKELFSFPVGGSSTLTWPVHAHPFKACARPLQPRLPNIIWKSCVESAAVISDQNVSYKDDTSSDSDDSGLDGVI